MKMLSGLAVAAILFGSGTGLLPGNAAAQDRRSFPSFLAEIEAEAISQGIRPEITQHALKDVEHIDKVIELDRRQPEFTLSFQSYMERVVSPARIERGRRLMAENRSILKAVEQRYHVPAKYIVALWGIETDFGRVTGGYSVVAALATLAYDGRRSAYFKSELMNALKILDQEHITVENMKGSWAGAMGQCQFMPSSFLKFAEDGDGDGRRDIWGTRADVLASAANYLFRSGWDQGTGWGRAVKLPANFSKRLIGLDQSRSLREWSKLGVKSANGKTLPATGDLSASLVLAEGDKGPAFLVYDNFRVFMKWNRSVYFALAAGHLADRIGAE